MSRMQMLLVVLSVGAALAVPAPAAAQLKEDCGTECVQCSLSWEGRGYDLHGRYNMNCGDILASYCIACHMQERVGEAAPGADALIQTIKSTAGRDLKEALMRHRDRLLLDPERNLIVVKGSGCNPEALSTVLFVSREKMSLLRDLGLTNLREYLRHT